MLVRDMNVPKLESTYEYAGLPYNISDKPLYGPMGGYIRVNENGITWIREHLECLVQKVLAAAPDSAAPCAGSS